MKNLNQIKEDEFEDYLNIYFKPFPQKLWRESQRFRAVLWPEKDGFRF